MKPIILRGHEKPINSIKFNYDGDLLFTASSDKRINLWYSNSGERIGNFDCNYAVKVIDVSTDSKYLVAGTLGGDVEIFDVLAGKRIGYLKKTSKVKTVEFSYGCQYLLVSYEGIGRGSENEVYIYEFDKILKIVNQEDPVEASPQLAHKSFKVEKKLSQISWGNLNKYLIASTQEGGLMDLSLDGKVLKELKGVHDGEIISFKIAKDFSILITAAVDGSKILDPSTYEVKRYFKQEVPMNTVAISPLFYEKNDKKAKYHCLMAGGIPAREAAKVKQGGFEIHLCNIMYEEEIGTIAGHFSPVNCVAFFTDGRGFVSGGEEGIVRLYRFTKNYYDDKVLE